MVRLKDSDILWLSEKPHRAIYEQDGSTVRGTTDHGSIDSLIACSEDLIDIEDYSDKEEFCNVVRNMLSERYCI